MKIWQTWKSHDPATFPPIYAKFQPTWKAKNPSCDYRLLDDDDILRYCNEHFPGYVSCFMSYGKQVQRADIVRYMVMFMEGGLYADMDFMALKDHEPLWKDSQAYGAVLGSLHDATNQQFPNAWMLSTRPGEIFWLLVLSMALERSGQPGQIVEWYTGPMLLTEAVHVYRQYQGMVHGMCQGALRCAKVDASFVLYNSPIKVLEPDAVYAVDWQRWQRWKMQQRELQDATDIEALYPNSLAVTFWCHNWPA